MEGVLNLYWDTQGGRSVPVAGCLGILAVLPLQLIHSEPGTPERYQPYSQWAKRKICAHLVRLMHPGAHILLHMCVFCLGGQRGESLLTHKKHKNVIRLGAGITFMFDLVDFDNAFQPPMLFSFISVVCLQYRICREGLFHNIDAMPNTRREGGERKS